MVMLSEQEFVARYLSSTPPVGCDLKVGDRVTFTNEFGVVFPGKVIIGFELKPNIPGRVVHLHKDAFWFPVPVSSLVKEV